MIEFRIEDQPDQQFSTILERRRTTMRLVYNQTSERWSFDLSIDDLPVVTGRRIVTGVDLLAAFNLGIGVIFAAPMKAGAVPGRDQLVDGTVKIYQTTEDEIATIVVPVVEPQTPNVRPIIWTPPAPVYFGQEFQIARMLDDIEEGLAVDFLLNEILIRSNIDPAMNYIGTVDAAISAGKLEFLRASTAFRYQDDGLLGSVANDVLRLQHDPLTGEPLGVLLEPASTNLVASSAVAASGSSVNITANAVNAPDGSLTADLVAENSSTGEHYMGDHTIAGTTVGQKYLWSAFVKKTDNPRPFHLRTATGKNASAYFNPATGAWLGGADYLSRGFETLPNDWFRVWMIVEIQTAGNLVCRAQLANWALSSIYTGDNVSGLYVWGRDVRLLDRFVEHFPTSGGAAGPAADDLKIPTIGFPWLDGVGQLQINDVVTIPNEVADKLVIPTIVGPVRKILWIA